MTYLEIKEATKKARTLKLLKRKLSIDWKEIQEPSEQKAIEILSNLCRESKNILETSKNNPNGMFAIKNIHANKLFTFLAQEQFKKLNQ